MYLGKVVKTYNQGEEIDVTVVVCIIIFRLKRFLRIFFFLYSFR